MNPTQPKLFGLERPLPGGFAYRPDLLSPDEERQLVKRFADLPFNVFESRAISASGA